MRYSFPMIQIVLIALGLSMDAFAVSVSSGMCLKGLKPWQALRAAAFFGAFQALMPLLGWLAGAFFKGYIQSFDHWIAFALLCFIGGKMSYEALKEILAERRRGPGAACEAVKADSGGITRLWPLTVLSIATSIDALAVGLSLSMLGQAILVPALVIGAITFALCLFGVFFGKRIGSALGEWAEVLGGLVLIGIGIKIIVEHIAKGL